MNTITLPKGHADIAAFRAVCSALSKDKSLFAMTHLLIQDNTAVATDVHRIHTAQLTDTYADGLYQVIKSTNTAFVAVPAEDLDASDFPDYKRVIPNTDKCGQEVTLGTDVHISLAKCIRVLPKNRCVNIDYFCDALALFIDGCTAAADNFALRMGDTGGRLAVIALMRIEE